MDSFLNQLPFDPGYLLVGLFAFMLLLIIWLFVSLHKTKKNLDEMVMKYEKFMGGKNAESLEQRFMAAFNEIERLGKVQKAHKAEMEHLDHRVQKSYQKMGLIKYNGFAGMGGMASFVLTLLDESNAGFALNVIHSREGSYPYIKEIRDGKSETALGPEEKNSLEMAMRSL